MKIFFLALSLLASLASAKVIDLKTPSTVLRGVPFQISFSLASTYRGTLICCSLILDNLPWPTNTTVYYRILMNGKQQASAKKEFKPYEQDSFPIKDLTVSQYSVTNLTLEIYTMETAEMQLLASADAELYGIPGILSLLPSVVTIILAVWLKQNILALFAGIFLGSTFINRYNPLVGIIRTVDTLIVNELAEKSHASVIYFCLMIGGMIAVVGRGGGASGMAKAVTRFAKTRRSGQLVTFSIGILTFFDDYASCLISGSTMRDIGAQLKISREKLSFIVDTCAATIACLFIVSSWVGVEVTYIQEQFKECEIKQNAYSAFLAAIPYKFYPIVVLIFTLILILSGRDFGPMWKAE